MSKRVANYPKFRDFLGEYPYSTQPEVPEEVVKERWARAEELQKQKTEKRKKELQNNKTDERNI